MEEKVFVRRCVGCKGIRVVKNFYYVVNRWRMILGIRVGGVRNEAG